MTMWDAGLRGGAVALLVLLAISGLRDARHFAVARYAILFDACAVAYLVESAPDARDLHAGWLVPLRLLSNAAPAVFELWTAASFDDGFAPRWWRWLPFGGLLGLSCWAILSDRAVAHHVVAAAALLLVAIGLTRTLSGRARDLVDARRRYRLVFAGGLGLLIAGTTLLGLAGVAALPGASGVLGLTLAGALMRLRVAQPADAVSTARPAEDAVPPAPALPAGPANTAPAATAAERALQERLRVLMEQTRVYREPGLTVGTLAERLAVPEYRLRRLINQRLGHRNFVGFVTSYRLADAIDALGDPARARLPVLTIALDAGFQSIGPFNRAFKAQTGQTPTEFRRERLGGGQCGVKT